jgi:CheY-like chemotaxis protein
MSNELQGLRIVLADDHAVVRLGFRLLLEGWGPRWWPRPSGARAPSACMPSTAPTCW